MNDINPKKITTITTLEVAEMLGTRHYKILEKLDGTKDGKTKGIIEILTAHDFVVSDYFMLSTYKDKSGKENRCYLVTKLGCNFLANKFTGEKGIIFTAKYAAFSAIHCCKQNKYLIYKKRDDGTNLRSSW